MFLTPVLGEQQFTSAVITQTVNEVRILHISEEARSAKLNDEVGNQHEVATGRRSRAELTFPDKTITRLGSNTFFSFKPDDRTVELKQGTMLLQVPKNSGGATILTSSVTAAIRGTTIMMEYTESGQVKLIALEGVVELFTPDGQKVTLTGGKMVLFDEAGGVLTKPVDVDVERLVETSKLIDVEVFEPLPSSALLEINKEIKKQRELIDTGILSQQNINRERETEIIQDIVSRIENNKRLNETPMEEMVEAVEVSEEGVPARITPRPPVDGGEH